MSDQSTVPPLEWLYDCLVLESYGHMKFSNDVEMPNLEKFTKKNLERTSDVIESNDFTQGPKAHPVLAESVYFSGINELNNLPNQDPEAIKNYVYQLKNQLRLKKELNMKIKPRF